MHSISTCCPAVHCSQPQIQSLNISCLGLAHFYAQADKLSTPVKVSIVPLDLQHRLCQQPIHFDHAMVSYCLNHAFLCLCMSLTDRLLQIDGLKLHHDGTFCTRWLPGCFFMFLCYYYTATISYWTRIVADWWLFALSMMQIRHSTPSALIISQLCNQSDAQIQSMLTYPSHEASPTRDGVCHGRICQVPCNESPTTSCTHARTHSLTCLRLLADLL